MEEPYAHVGDDAFTNASAAKALRVAIVAAEVVGAEPDPRWAQIAAKLHSPSSVAGQHHLDFDPSAKHDSGSHDQAFLASPSLDLQMKRRKPS